MADLKEVLVPDIGTTDMVEIIEVSVAAGDEIEAEDVLITLESDKASMDIPASEPGIVKEVKVKVGDKVSTGQLILMLEPITADQQPEEPKEELKKEETQIEEPKSEDSEKSKVTEPVQEPTLNTSRPAPVAPIMPENTGLIYTSPSVRRLAFEFGIDLNKVSGTGRKGRIVKVDVQNYVKSIMAGDASTGNIQGGLSTLPMPDIDFTKFGEIETTELSRIKKISAQNLHRNWVMIPHVTQFDEVDISEMEAFRKANKDEALKQGYKLTPLVFLMKAAAKTLKQFQNFNSSLLPNGESLVLKKYFHIGVAVDTPKGLVVPVIRDVDQKGLFELADELGTVSQKARDLKLTAADMQGSCFTISSLGGIGGTAFTPIINAPDVAILGVSRSQMKPIYNGSEFEPKLMLPLSLSYDHRVIDGAEAARFITYLGKMLVDIRRLLL